MSIDVRAHSTTPIIAPYPLPHVSRRALTRVKDRMPPPQICPYCGSLVELVNNAVIYGYSAGKWPYAYACARPHCDAYVGLHPDTDLPLGTMANAELRNARKQSKAMFHELQRRWSLTRGVTYKLLAEAMDIPQEQCHFAWFDIQRCRDAYRACGNLLKAGPNHE